jgi:hypothetical protein
LFSPVSPAFARVALAEGLFLVCGGVALAPVRQLTFATCAAAVLFAFSALAFSISASLRFHLASFAGPS